MKTKIKVLVKEEGCEPVINKKGDWIDLRAAEDCHLHCPTAGQLKHHTDGRSRDVQMNKSLISLGVAMQLPKGFEAIMVPRSSNPKHYGSIMPHSIGIIDNKYNGNDDVWKFSMLAFAECDVKKGDRIAQFRIQLSQYATMWQKIKWLFSNGIKIEYVKTLNNNNRGGFGSSGKN